VPTICAIGTAAADIKARMTRPAIDTTDTPGRVTLSAGGVSRNIAENLARLGARAIFIGVFGDDAQAHSVIEHTRRAGVDVRPILRADHSTASMAITLDMHGEQIAGVFSGDILDTLVPSDLAPYLDLIRSADAVVCDGGAPQSVLQYLSEIVLSHTLFYCNPGSVALASRLQTILHRCDLLTCNQFEAEALSRASIASANQARHAAQQLVVAGVKRAVVTLGAAGIVYTDVSRGATRAASPTRLVDATGAGDALAAAMIFGLLQHQNDEIDAVLTLGLAAAAVTCESENSVSPDMSLRLLQTR
jgi:pseudouridine kinase